MWATLVASGYAGGASIHSLSGSDGKLRRLRRGGRTRWLRSAGLFGRLCLIGGGIGWLRIGLGFGGGFGLFPVRAGVGTVKPRTLKNYAHVIEHFAHMTTARGAFGERGVGHCLHDVVLGTAVFAGVGIRRHPQRLALDFSEC